MIVDSSRQHIKLWISYGIRGMYTAILWVLLSMYTTVTGLEEVGKINPLISGFSPVQRAWQYAKLSTLPKFNQIHFSMFAHYKIVARINLA